MKHLPPKLRSFFADYRAEWSASLFREYFVIPPYFEKLLTRGPCVLIGGRGTGKTTSLRSLRFDEAAARVGADQVAALPYFGIYLRINKNRVRAFDGPQHPRELWNKAFAHYFNVLSAIEICKLIDWMTATIAPVTVDFASVSSSFGYDQISSVTDLRARLEQSLSALELWVNNPTKTPQPIFSLAESPLRRFCEALESVGVLKDKTLFCCIDEYENLFDHQQSVLNTYIKHASPPLSYKIGARRNGIRSRATIDTADVLSAPEDYLEIDIANESFDSFAREVLEKRLGIASHEAKLLCARAEQFLPELSFAEEAKLLGCERIAKVVRDDLAENGDANLVEWAANTEDSRLYFLKYWSDAEKGSVPDLATQWRSSPSAWETRLANYGYASLFWLSRGRKGARIRKYYAGWRTLLALASGNIRYFIELIDESLASVAEEPSGMWEGFVPPENQTLAARTVAKRRLDQLESLSEHGSAIKRLVLGIGKVFFELARDPLGRSPEQNSFVLSGETDARERVLALLHEGVAYLAFEVAPRTKATTEAEMRDDEFRLHPIFAPFFEYSHRRKRRITFDAELLLGLLDQPRKAVAALLADRQQTPIEELPVQLALFSPFYDAEQS